MQFDRDTIRAINNGVVKPVYTEFRPTRKCLHDIDEVRNKLRKQEKKKRK